MTNRPARPTFALTIEAAPSYVPADVRMRAALKVLRRRFGLRAVHVGVLISGETPCLPASAGEAIEPVKRRVADAIAGRPGTVSRRRIGYRASVAAGSLNTEAGVG